MKRKRLWIALTVLAALLMFAAAALDQRLIVRKYVIDAAQITEPVRLAVLTDYHGCDYGLNGAELVKQTEVLAPDAILLVGDMFSDDQDCSDELAFFALLKEIAPTFYVTGNHEYWEQDVPVLMAEIEYTGVSVLDQNCAELLVNGQNINICGIPDPYAYVDTEIALNRAAEDAGHLGFTILLAHRPELIDKYAAAGIFDLVVSGHAHGGQVRIPLLVNGLCAPNQGWFPRYAGGRYEADGTTMIVSRGLSTQRQMGIPRIFNRPELVVVELK